MNALPLQFLMLILSGWVNRHQQDVIEYLQEENRALREQLGGKRLRSLKSECLSQIIPLGEQHLRHAVKEYAEHYHVERNHQGLENRLIEKRDGVVDMDSAVRRRERLGGILNYYERRVA